MRTNDHARERRLRRAAARLGYALATAGVESRKRGVSKPPRTKRPYLLAGLAYCTCGARRRGDARVHKGVTYRYYGCPVADGRGKAVSDGGVLRTCSERRIRAEVAEEAELGAVRALVLPPAVIDAARDELRIRLKGPPAGLVEQQRARLKGRLEALRKEHQWGDLDDREYLRLRDETERQLTLLPDHEKLVAFDRHRGILVSMAENLERATPAQQAELVALLVERVMVTASEVREIVWTPAARPFFGDAQTVPASPEERDPLAYYSEAAPAAG